MRQERPLEECTRWFNTLATHFPKLSRAQVRTLALWSFAATLTQHIASTTCCCFLAQLFDQPQQNLRQRLREFYWEAQHKRGAHRETLQVERCFAPLLRWILSLYRADELPLALDVTLCRDRLAVLSLSVVFRGSALPVAWKILPANEAEPWMPHCIALLRHVGAVVPEPMPVMVLCDRGLQSRSLFRAIVALGWHPMIRLTRCGSWRPEGDSTWYALSTLLAGPGRYYLGRGHLFKREPFRCTLIGLWEDGYATPWLLMTDLSPERCRGAFYGLRSWIEQGFRVMKSGAYHCERLRVSDPARAERIWMVLAVSLLWTHAVGAGEVAKEEPCGLSLLVHQGVRRLLGVHRSGWIVLLVSAIRGEPLPLPGRLFTAARPAEPHGVAACLRAPP